MLTTMSTNKANNNSNTYNHNHNNKRDRDKGGGGGRGGHNCTPDPAYNMKYKVADGREEPSTHKSISRKPKWWRRY